MTTREQITNIVAASKMLQEMTSKNDTEVLFSPFLFGERYTVLEGIANIAIAVDETINTIEVNGKYYKTVKFAGVTFYERVNKNDVERIDETYDNHNLISNL